MYLNILKKDLKRKKAMNAIVLVFVILATMFVASGVNNILTVTASLDRYMDMANTPDYIGITQNKALQVDVDEILDSAPSIDSYSTETVLILGDNNLIYDSDVIPNGIPYLQSVEDVAMNYFLSDNSILKTVPQGEVYVTARAATEIGLETGDKITIEI